MCASCAPPVICITGGRERATIDQAKGIVMAERRCTPEEAFEVLRTLSQRTNVRVADVALALVYKCQGSGSLGIT